MKFISRTRVIAKTLFDRIRNENLKKNILQALPFWLASFLTGLISVLYARLFVWAEGLTALIVHSRLWLLFIITPVCVVISWWIVIRFAPYARGSGIPQVMAAIELANPKDNRKVNRLLSLRIIFVKMLSSLVMAIGGGVIGREGPTIQVAGSIFRKVNQWLPEWWPKISKRNMIMTGAAAGLAAAFNTPLGGIVFAVEELTKTHISFFKTALFTAVIIAGLTAQGLFGPYLYLGYPDVSHLSGWIFLPILLVAVIAGLTGSATAKIILLIFKWKSRFGNRFQYALYAIVAAVVLAAIAFFVSPDVLGSGKNIMTSTLFGSEKYLPWYEPVLRVIGPVLSFTVGGAGGIFAPALSAGSSIGSVMAGWMHESGANANIMILCGMVGFLTGITRTPFTSAILVLEMTDRHNVIFHLMLAGMIAGLVSMVVDRHSFYDHLKNQYLRSINREHQDEETITANEASTVS